MDFHATVKLISLILISGGVWNRFGFDAGMIALGVFSLLDVWHVDRTNAALGGTR